MKMRKIATEEAWSIPEVAAELEKVSNGPSQSLDKLLVKGIYDQEGGGAQYAGVNFLDGLLDAEDVRLKQMDELGIDMHLLALTAPGVQMFDADTAMELAILSNDILAGLCKKYPLRFASLASFAPHSPKRAAKEMDRAINELGMNGFMINSHTYDEYLDDPKFWPILEAAEALDRCIYIHPRAASNGFKDRCRTTAWTAPCGGYGVEVGTHAVRMMAGGVFDAFPKLKICIGHMGEAVPFWLWRLNFMNSRAQKAGRSRKTKRSMAEYFQDNFVVTNSGVEDDLALRYSIDKLGIDNVMWAIDYPYQPMKPSVDFIDNFPCTDAERHALCHGNAERIFHIAPLPE